MNIIITIECDNAAFEGDSGGHEVARILRKAAARIQERDIHDKSFSGFGIMDVNGNKVGAVDVQD